MNQKKIYEHLGSVVRTRRKQLKLTQDKLAKQLAMSRGSLANIELGNQGMPVHQLYLLAEVLKLRPEHFLLPYDEHGQQSRILNDEWEDVIPSDLKPEQRMQIARLMGDLNKIKKEE